jgi:uncharacterized membrane protein YagU involved in acid resistance
MRRRAVWKGALAGAVGGFVASWVMNKFQSSAASTHPDGEDATMKAAGHIAEAAFDTPLTKEERRRAGPVIHYVFGSAMGALYGAMAESAPRTATAIGLPFGTALWLGADEVAVPALGLSNPPTDDPTSTHTSALAAHLVYGLTADLVRRAVRAAI